MAGSRRRTGPDRVDPELLGKVLEGTDVRFRTRLPGRPGRRGTLHNGHYTGSSD